MTKRDRDIGELFDWMCDGAPGLADGRAIVSHICERLNAAGVPVDLYRLFLFTIHPIVKGRRLQWTAEGGTVINEADFSLFETEEFHDNPLPHVMETRRSLRRRLKDPDNPRDYKVLDELAAEGFTDYLVQPVIYVDGEVHTMSWSTRSELGFSDDDIAVLERIRPPLTRLVESYVLRLNAVNIISTYVGRDAGGQVLDGQIKRGDVEEIEAVILFADLKNYTSLSNALPPDEMLECLNTYFDAVAGPVTENGGEILKFMGDGILAIFPLKDGMDGAGAVVEKARAAVLEAARRAEEGAGSCPFRSSLHIGRLYYGNIGAAMRLDFTAIGPAVNLGARLLSAAGEIGVDHVCSREFADRLHGKAAEVARLPLKGFQGEFPIHTI